MFGELPKLFDREFLTGFFLPVALFLATAHLLLGVFGVNSPLTSAVWGEFQKTILTDTTLWAVLSWLGGTLLLVLNRLIYRLLEGYGARNPFAWRRRWEQARFQHLTGQIIEAKIKNQAYQKAKQPPPASLRSLRARLLQERAEQFPARGEDSLLPTAFGNAIRAWETYPQAMYGVEGTDSWPRLLAVLPKDFRALIDTAKAQADFWLNLWLLSVILIVEYIVLAAVNERLVLWGVLPAAALVCAGAVTAAKSAVIEWGVMVKSAYDIFLPDLWEKIGGPPVPPNTERTLWNTWSQAVLFRRPDLLPPRAGQRRAVKLEPPEDEDEADGEDD